MSAEPSPGAPPSPPPSPPTPPPAAWHAGIDAELIGHAQNKGWKIDDPKELSISALKQARELEKHFGVPPEQLVKMPKADARPEDIRAFHVKLGAPGDAKEYDFSNIKGADGNPIAATLADALRATAYSKGLTKEAATEVAGTVQKALDEMRSAEATISNGKLAEEKTKLAENWKGKYDFNHLTAMEGARRLGITPAAVKALEGQIGYAAVMEAMRKIGAATSEDTFVERGATEGGIPVTREGAVARKAELESDRDWSGRYLRGGMAEKREMDALIKMIDGDQ